VFNQKNPNLIQKRDLESFFTMLVKYGLKFGRIYVSTHYSTSGGKSIKAICIWQHPFTTKSKISKVRLLRAGASKIGVRAFMRFLKCVEVSEGVHSRILPQNTTPHWTLIAFGVDSKFRNRGIGSEVLLPIIRCADEAGLPIFSILYHYKNEVRDENVFNFLKRHGFDVKEQVEDVSHGPPFHVLVRYSFVY
jgi:GNAT superfamily N-acetyltransferase